MKLNNTTTRLIIISVFLISSLFNQDIYAQKTFNFGAKAGLNLADLFGDTYSGSTFKPGMAVGVLAEMPFSEKWSFAAELYYSAEGAKAYKKEPSDGSYTYSISQRINYINLPLIAKFNINQHWNVQAGPQFGFLLCAKEIRKVKRGVAPESFNEGTKNVYDRYRPFYISFFVGSEYEINQKMAVQARFYFSFFDKIKNNAGDSEGTYPLIFQFTYAYKFFTVPK